MPITRSRASEVDRIFLLDLLPGRWHLKRHWKFGFIVGKKSVKIMSACVTAIIAMVVGVTPAIAAPVFYSTAHVGDAYKNWEVATNPPGPDGGVNIDGDYNSFPIAGPFVQATACSGRANWIASSSSCSAGTAIRQWTHYVFRQSFDLTAAEAANLQLSFQWAADDSGQQIWAQGAWLPKWSLNSTAQADLVTGTWDPPVTWPGPTYFLGPVVKVGGFKEGKNTLYFFVQGNGITDGMSLMNAQFEVPEPSLLGLFALGALGLALRRRAA